MVDKIRALELLGRHLAMFTEKTFLPQVCVLGVLDREFGGANDKGTIFEIAKTAAGYASTPTTLVSFKGLTVPSRRAA